MESRNTLHTIPQKHHWFQWIKENSRRELSHIIRQAEKPKTTWIHRKNNRTRTTSKSEIFPHNKRKKHCTACITITILFEQFSLDYFSARDYHCVYSLESCLHVRMQVFLGFPLSWLFLFLQFPFLVS